MPKNQSKKRAPRQKDVQVWKSQAGEPPITGPGDWLAMMRQGGETLSDKRHGKKGKITTKRSIPKRIGGGK